MKLLVKYISLLLSYIIPENKKIIVFSSSPDFCDNAYAVFYYMIRNHDFKDYKFYWIVSDKHKTEDLISEDGISLQNNVFVLKRNTIISLWYTFRAKYLFYSVGIYTDFTFHNQRKRINMWHGMPLKHVGFDFRHGDFTIATSELFSNKMSNSLNIPLENVLITGQPRNDFLFHPELLPKYLCYIKKYSTVGIWMPTFRRSDTMAQHVDGSFDPEKISYLKISELEALNTILKRSNSILLIKFHPYDVFQKKKLGDLTNIKFIYNNCMHQKDLYILLSHCNYLLSDFSSVVVDEAIYFGYHGFDLWQHHLFNLAC